MGIPTTPDGFVRPAGNDTIGSLRGMLVSFMDQVQLALNSLTSKHVEFKAQRGGIANSTVQNVGAFVMDEARSTTKTMVVSDGDGWLKFNEVGVFAITAPFEMGIAASGRTFFEFQVQGSTFKGARAPIPSGEDSTYIGYGNVRVTEVGQRILFNMYRNVSDTSKVSTTTVYVTKVGRL